MSENDLKPGNPLRVSCRTCKAAALAACIGLAIDTSGPRFHKKRVRDALQDYRKNWKLRTEQAEARGLARRPNRASTPIVSVLDRPDNERAISKASRHAKDMQTPEFWAAVWSET